MIKCLVEGLGTAQIRETLNISMKLGNDISGAEQKFQGDDLGSFFVP